MGNLDIIKNKCVKYLMNFCIKLRINCRNSYNEAPIFLKDYVNRFLKK